MFKTTQRVPFKFNKKTSHLKILHSRRDSTSMRYTMLLYYPFPKLYKINSQSLEDTQVGYISQKCTLDKNTSEKCTLKNTLPPELRNLALNLCNLAHNLRNPAHNLCNLAHNLRNPALNHFRAFKPSYTFLTI